MAAKPKIETFNVNHPVTENDRLTSVLIKELRAVTRNFICADCETIQSGELFSIIHTAIFGYLNLEINALIRTMTDDEQIPIFINSCREMFDMYFQRLLERDK